MFDYSRKMDNSAPDKTAPDRSTPDKTAPVKSMANIRPQQKYHSKLFLGNQIGLDMEIVFRDLYDRYGDFHIVNLSVLNGNQILLVYAIPRYR